MICKKDLIIVALATFCLTATLFMILPTRSQPPTYDPWLDTNSDGVVNIMEAILVGSHFMTTGDPTKNVNVTNWPQITEQWEGHITIQPGHDYIIENLTNGYTQATYGFMPEYIDPMVPIYVDVYMSVASNDRALDLDSFTMNSVSSWYTRTYDISIGAKIYVDFFVPGSSNVAGMVRTVCYMIHK